MDSSVNTQLKPNFNIYFQYCLKSAVNQVKHQVYEALEHMGFPREVCDAHLCDQTIWKMKESSDIINLFLEKANQT